MLEKHLDEAVLFCADIEKQLCEVEDKPKTKIELSSFSSLSSVAQSSKKGPKEEV